MDATIQCGSCRANIKVSGPSISALYAFAIETHYVEDSPCKHFHGVLEVASAVVPGTSSVSIRLSVTRAQYLARLQP